MHTYVLIICIMYIYIYNIYIYIYMYIYQKHIAKVGAWSGTTLARMFWGRFWPRIRRSFIWDVCTKGDVSLLPTSKRTQKGMLFFGYWWHLDWLFYMSSAVFFVSLIHLYLVVFCIYKIIVALFDGLLVGEKFNHFKNNMTLLDIAKPGTTGTVT